MPPSTGRDVGREIHFIDSILGLRRIACVRRYLCENGDSLYKIYVTAGMAGFLDVMERFAVARYSIARKGETMRLRANEVARGFDVDYERLWATGVRALLFDLDNTLSRRASKKLGEEARELLRGLEERGFRVGILTNRKRGPANELAVELAKQFTRRGIKLLMGTKVDGAEVKGDKVAVKVSPAPGGKGEAQTIEVEGTFTAAATNLLPGMSGSAQFAGLR
jgi:hypothetical protein